MTEPLLSLALLAILGTEIFDAYALRRLDWCCVHLDGRRRVDPGLLRWYALGFERPRARALWCLAASLGLLAVGVLVHGHPAQIVAALALALAARLQHRYCRRRARLHVARSHPRGLDPFTTPLTAWTRRLQRNAAEALLPTTLRAALPQRAQRPASRLRPLRF